MDPGAGEAGAPSLTGRNPSLHCTNALTIEAWVFPTSHGAHHEIVSKWGVLNTDQTSYTATVGTDGLAAIGVCPNGNPATAVGLWSTNSLPLNRWTHFAGTYDGSALRIYINGVCENQIAYNQGIFPGTDPLAIGAAGAFAGGQVLSPFAGRIDEPSVYSRALSAAEIQAIYNSSSAGKCSLPPTISTQPVNQTVIVGDTATLIVVAGGNSPLTYQWRLNGTNIATATGDSLALANVQLSRAGNYDVIVANDSGSVTSAVATLLVQIPAGTYYDFETAETTPVWLGTTQMVQNTSASHRGTNAIALTANYPNGYLLTKLPQGTTNVEFYFYDAYGPNPPLYAYMTFWLLEATNSTPFAGFMMNDGGWGTTPPRTMNHYYAYATEEYSARTMGPLRTIGWHKFAFAIGSESVAMSVDGTLVFQANMLRVARYLQFQSSLAGGWGRIDDIALSVGNVVQPLLSISRTITNANAVVISWPYPSTGFALQQNTTLSATNWSNVTNAPVQVGGDWQVTESLTPGNKLYRLMKS